MHGHARCFRPRQENGPDAPGQAPAVTSIAFLQSPCTSPVSAHRRTSGGHGGGCRGMPVGRAGFTRALPAGGPQAATDARAIWVLLGTGWGARGRSGFTAGVSTQISTGRTLATEYTSQPASSRSLVEWGPWHSCMYCRCAVIIRHSRPVDEWWPRHRPALCSGSCKSRQHTRCIPPCDSGP